MDLRRALIPRHFGLRWDVIPDRIGQWNVILAERLADRLTAVASLRPDLTVSGDCMVALSARRNHLPLVWMDAHGDFNTLLTTETGSIGGMPLAMLAGLGDQALMGLLGRTTPRLIYHVGGSEFDDGEISRMYAHGVCVLSQLTSWNTGPIHLHIDTDVIRSSDLPSSIHPAPNGMPLAKFYEQLDVLLPHTEVLSIKSYDPSKDVDGIGQSIVLEIIRRYETYVSSRY